MAVEVHDGLTGGDSAVHSDVIPVWTMVLFDDRFYRFNDADQLFFFLCREVKEGLSYRLGDDETMPQ